MKAAAYNQVLPACAIIMLSLFATQRGGFAQAQGTVPWPCATMEMLQRDIARDSTLLSRFRALENVVPPDGERAGGVITVPVMVHVVYSNSTQNISEAQIQSAIQVLNEDYRRQNADASFTLDYSQFGTYPADCEIEFCLAGITRTFSSIPAFQLDPALWGVGDIALVKDIAPGYGQGYLNVWVCHLDGWAGYATFPGIAPSQYDGITVDYTYMGRTGVANPTYAGRTITHEVGHWLGLFHIWGNPSIEPVWYFDGIGWGYNCGDDLVPDTWPQHRANPNGCNWDQTACANYGLYNPYNPMNQNFMDYTFGQCMNFFSLGQKDRIWYHVNTYRSYLLSPATNCRMGLTEGRVAGYMTFSFDPASGTIDLQGVEGNTQTWDISVFDAGGRQVSVKTSVLITNGSIVTMSVQDLSSGSYLLRGVNASRQFTFRFMK